MYISIELTKEQQDHFERMAREVCGVKPSSFDGNVSFSFDGKVSFSYEGFKIKKDGTPGAVSGFVSSSNLEKVS